MSEGGKRVMEVDDFSALEGLPVAGLLGRGGERAGGRRGRSSQSRQDGALPRGREHGQGQPALLGRAGFARSSAVTGNRRSSSSISRDITEEWEASRRERFLTEELAHRAKNSFAMVLAIAQQTFRGAVHASPLETYTARVIALAKAHDVVTAVELGQHAHRRGDRSGRGFTPQRRR